VNRGNGDDQVERLLEREVLADLAGLDGRGEQGPGGRDDPGAVGAEDRVAGVRVP